MDWKRRLPRAKYDPQNVLLDMGYTFLFNLVDALLQSYGFDTYKGFYHTLFFQRKSLACDIMEPFRVLIDKQLVKSWNLGQIKLEDFEYKYGKYQLSWEKSSYYATLFLEVLTENKDEIYSFTKGFYYHIMNTEKDLPKWNITARKNV